MIDPKLLNAITEESEKPPVHLEIARTEAFILIGVLQLAQRHPNLPSCARNLCSDFVRKLKGFYPPELQEMIDRGNDPANDVYL